METNIQVSIICNAYNHEPYIREALDSFLMQRTDFSYEILIHDDASTDKTADIIREYEQKYPGVVKPIYQSENQYSQKVDISLEIQCSRAKGKYIAFCEGDDYWTDPLKLQKQFDALEKHPEVDMCAHAALRIDPETKAVNLEIAPSAKDGIIPVEDVIAGEGGFVATNSLMYRAALNREIPRFRRNLSFDYSLQIHGSLRGGLLYLADYMAVYRFMAAGSWTSKQMQNKERRVQLLNKKQKMLSELNEDTERRYEQTIRQRMLENEFQFYYQEADYQTAFASKYRAAYRKDGLTGELKLRLKAIFPFLNGITQRFK